MKRKPAIKTKHFCRERKHAIPITRFRTLSVKGEPTLAECPYSPKRKRLLSEEACETHFLCV